MPDMHFRIVENVPKDPVIPTHISVIQMTDQNREHMDQDELLDPKTYHCQGNVLRCFIYDGFHKMEPELGGKPHFLYAVMHFVKFPQPGPSMQLPVNVPLDEIGNHQHYQQLGPNRETFQFKSHDIIHAEEL